MYLALGLGLSMGCRKWNMSKDLKSYGSLGLVLSYCFLKPWDCVEKPTSANWIIREHKKQVSVPAEQPPPTRSGHQLTYHWPQLFESCQGTKKKKKKLPIWAAKLMTHRIMKQMIVLIFQIWGWTITYRKINKFTINFSGLLFELFTSKVSWKHTDDYIFQSNYIFQLRRNLFS